MNYISHNVVYLNSAEQKAILNIVKSDRMKKILAGQLNLTTLRLSVKTKELLSRAIELNNLASKFSTMNRKVKVSLQGLKDIYVLSKYVIDSNCSRNCEFKPSSENDVNFNQGYVETIELSPYSVQLLVFKKKLIPPVVLAGENQITSLQAEVKLQDNSVEIKSAETKSTEVKLEEKLAETKPAEVKPQEKPPLKETSNAGNK
jgi:hypothetical protein